MAYETNDLRRKEEDCILQLQKAPIKIVVGSKRKTFYIDEGLLRKARGFFDSALNKTWKEGQERVIELPEDDPETFQMYAQWLYTGNVFCKVVDTSGDFVPLAKQYAFGERILDRKFQNGVIDAIITATHDPRDDGRRGLPGAGAVNHIYQHTPPGSPARLLMIHFYVLNGSCAPDSFDEYKATLVRADHEFVVDVTMDLFNRCQLLEKDRTELKNLDKAPASAYHHPEN